MSRIRKILGTIRRPETTRKEQQDNSSATAPVGLSISEPTDFKCNFHVGYNKDTREYVGLPRTWQNWLDASLTVEEKQVLNFKLRQYQKCDYVFIVVLS